MSDFEKKDAPVRSEHSEHGDKPKFFKRPMRRKVCAFCADKVSDIDYKDVDKLKKFVTEKGKILPRRQTGTCAKHQRQLTVAIRRARIMALLPFEEK